MATVRAARFVNGVLRGVDVESTLPTIYAQSLEVVASGAGANQINGPITSGTPVTLPSSGTYSNDDLFIFLNGVKMDSIFDYNFVGTVPRTQVSFTFDLVANDKIEFVKQRNS